ncbi:hypothetical protein Zmor_012291 [Zophobas morio]|uniref:Uncharacterized protein n=1 Tax=Zophobas morio TaxID=2755281 RepID=A0AA38LZ94_9CUCU|nr:hypothetical protein Zmor_012291 [Zophobas morio]
MSPLGLRHSDCGRPVTRPRVASGSNLSFNCAFREIGTVIAYDLFRMLASEGCRKCGLPKRRFRQQDSTISGVILTLALYYAKTLSIGGANINYYALFVVLMIAVWFMEVA